MNNEVDFRSDSDEFMYSLILKTATVAIRFLSMKSI